MNVVYSLGFLGQALSDLELDINLIPGINTECCAWCLKCWVHGGEVDGVARKMGEQLQLCIVRETEPAIIKFHQTMLLI